MRDYRVGKTMGALAAVACAIVMLARSTRAQNDGADAYQPPEGMQVLTRGPVHEAFAEPIVYNPEPGPVVPKEPPQPVDEIPPDQKPEGENVQWIPGYWSWEDAQGDFLWVSGIWRDIPPGRQWVPGYWVQAKPENGWRRVAGSWASTEQEQVTYLPEPPKSLEVGPNAPQPNPESIWVPGIWYWGEERYSWRPGFWLPVVADWVWVPAHYVWTPGGYLYVEGYWDRPLVQRGIVFAPVRFERPIYTQPQFRYSPAVTLLTTVLTTNLFVRPATYQYYFGDYYADRYTNSGYYPWYELQRSRRGYDPVYAHLAAINTRQNPQWPQQLAEVYQYRRTHQEARPPQTYSGLRALTQRTKVQQTDLTTQNVATIQNINVQNTLLAQPIAQLASNDRLRPVRFERVAPERRETIVKQVRELREVSDRRVREEAKVVQDRPANFRLERPRFVALPRSPIVAEAVTPARSPASNEPGTGKAADGTRSTAAAPPPPPPQSAPGLAAQPTSAADQANQKSAEAERASRRRVLRPRPDQLTPGDGSQGTGPDADNPRPGQAPSARPGERPSTKPEPARPGRPGRPDPASPASPGAARPDSPTRPGLDRAPDRPGAPQPGRPDAGRPDLPAGPSRPGGLIRPGSQPELPPGLNRPGTRPEPGGPNPTLPGQPDPNRLDRPGMNRPEVRPDLPGTRRPDQPGLGRPGQPDALPNRSGPTEPRGGQPPLGTQPGLGTPRDRPGAARPGVDPLAPLPGSPTAPPGPGRALPPGVDRPVPGAAAQPGFGPSDRPAPGAPGLGRPDRPGLNPASPSAPGAGLPRGRDGANRPVPPVPSPATTKPAPDSGAGQP